MSKHLKSVIRLINKYGTSSSEDTALSIITYNRTTDPDDPSSSINTSSTNCISSYQGKHSSNEIDGTVVRKSDIKLYVVPTSLTTVPSTNDKISDGTTIWNIENISSWKSKNTIVLYAFQLRE